MRRRAVPPACRCRRRSARRAAPPAGPRSTRRSCRRDAQSTMSMRPLLSSTCWVNAGVTPPCRMNVPSCTLRTRSSAGLKVIDSVTADSRVAPEIDIGTVYGPPPTRISLGGLSVIRARRRRRRSCAAQAARCGGARVPAQARRGARRRRDRGGAAASVSAEARLPAPARMPGIGELAGGTTGRCVLPVGNTGAAGGLRRRLRLARWRHRRGGRRCRRADRARHGARPASRRRRRRGWLAAAADRSAAGRPAPCCSACRCRSGSDPRAVSSCVRMMRGVSSITMSVC